MVVMGLSDTSLRISHFTTAFFWLSFGTCQFVYVVYQLKKHHHEQYFVKRRPLLVVATIIGLYFCVIFAAAASCNRGLNTYSVNNNDFVQTIWVLMFVLNWISGTALTLVANLYIIRCWLLYYDMQVSQLLRNKHWQMAINPTIESKNWFLNPKNQRIARSNGIILLIVGILAAMLERCSYVTLWFLNFQIIGAAILGVLLLIKVEYYNYNYIFCCIIIIDTIIVILIFIDFVCFLFCFVLFIVLTRS